MSKTPPKLVPVPPRVNLTELLKAEWARAKTLQDRADVLRDVREFKRDVYWDRWNSEGCLFNWMLELEEKLDHVALGWNGAAPLCRQRQGDRTGSENLTDIAVRIDQALAVLAERDERADQEVRGTFAHAERINEAVRNPISLAEADRSHQKYKFSQTDPRQKRCLICKAPRGQWCRTGAP